MERVVPNGCDLYTSSKNPGLDPIENIIVYTDDACMFELTPGQAIRMK
jgi:hypothetical protein